MSFMTPPYAGAIFVMKGVADPEFGLTTGDNPRRKSIYCAHNGWAWAVHSFSWDNPLATQYDDKVVGKIEKGETMP